MRVLFVLFLIPFLFIACGIDPGTIEGTVVDKNGNPIKDVAITSKDFKFTTSTDEKGHYKFINLPNGVIQLFASKRLEFIDNFIDTLLPSENGLEIDFILTSSEFSNLKWEKVESGKIFIDIFWQIYKDSVTQDFYMSKYEISNKLFLEYLNTLVKLGEINVELEKHKSFFGGYLPPDKKDFLVVYDKFGNGILRLGRTPGQLSNYKFAEASVRNATSDIYYENSTFKIYSGFEDHPVRCLSFIGAKNFATFYGCRIPIYTEWWRAAFADKKDYWDNKFNTENINYAHSYDPYEDGPNFQTTPVGFYDGTNHLVQLYDDEWEFATQDAKSPFGLYDMIGNVKEFIIDAEDKPEAVGYSYLDLVGHFTETPTSTIKGFVTPIDFDELNGKCGVRLVKDIR